MHILDWIVLLAYVAVVVGIGAWANRKQTDTEAYFLGGRSMPWWAAGLSIIATSFSAASILGVPGYAYSSDMWYLQYTIGDLAAAAIVVLLFIPFFHRIRGITTAYEYLEERFDLKTRLLGSTFFILTTVLRAGTLLYGAALLFSRVVPTDVIPGLNGIEEAIVIFGIIAIIYTVMGGISAVIWTDVIQFSIMTFGVIASMAIVVMETPGGLGATFGDAGQLEKLQVFHVANPLGGTGLVTAVFAYGLLALALYGTNQQPVQRYLTVKNPREAQKALILGVLAGGVGVVLSLLLGVFLFVFYDHHAGLLPDGISADKVMPLFVKNQVPVILTGALVSSVFAAAMSSLDSALNSTAAAATVDFLERFRPNISEQKRLFFAKIVVVTVGIIGIGVGIYAAQTETLLISLILQFVSWFAGGLLGLFTLGMLTKRANEHGAFMGAIIGTLVALITTENFSGLNNLFEWFGFTPLPFIWATTVGFGVTWVAGYVISLFGHRPRSEQIENTTARRTVT